MRSSCFPACPARENRRLPSGLCSLRHSDGISNPSHHMRADCLIRLACRMWIPLKVFHRLSRCSSNAERRASDRRQGALRRYRAAWPSAWQGQNLRDILVTLGHDIDSPWRELPKRVRNWMLFTDEQPTVPVYAGFSAAEVRSARRRRRGACRHRHFGTLSRGAAQSGKKRNAIAPHTQSKPHGE